MNSMDIQAGEEGRTKSRDTLAWMRTILDEHGDIDDDDEEDDVPLTAKSLIEITDPQTLDMLLVFGKPFVLARSFWKAALAAFFQGTIVIFV